MQFLNGLRTSLVLVLLFLTSCSPEVRMKRLLKKHPELYKTFDKTVTVTEIDTIIIPPDSSSFQFVDSCRDTVIHDTTFKHIIRYVRKGVGVNIDVKDQWDTIYQTDTLTVKVPCNCPTVEECEKTFWYKIIIGGLIALFIIALLKQNNKNNGKS
jgi:hypothetical protein